MRRELAIGGASFAAVAPVAYAFERVVERAMLLEPNPAAIVWTDRSAFTWRVIIALYAGGAAGIGGVIAARRSRAGSARLLLVVVAASAVVAALQALVVP